MENIHESVPHHLKCPVCLEIPRDKVFQCKEGHIICEACYEKLVKKPCPQCRVELPRSPIRCRAVEEMLDSLKLEFPCEFQSAGCEKRLDRKQIAEHISSCKYNIQKFGKLIQVCGVFGFKSCSFSVNRANTAEALAHFQSAHGMRSIKAVLTKPFTFAYKNLMDIFSNSQKIIFSPFIFDQKWWGYNFAYIIVTRFNPVDKTLQFTPFYLVHGENLTKRVVPEPINFALGGSRANISCHNLLLCEGLTLDYFGYFAAPLQKWLNADKPETYLSTLQIKFRKQMKIQPPQNSDGVLSMIRYSRRDVLTQSSKNERTSNLIHQVFSVGAPQNWDKFAWIPYHNYKNCKNRFSAASTSFSPTEKMLICRTNICFGIWLAGCIKIDNEMNAISPALFHSPDLLTKSKLITLKQNFEVLYTPPNSFEWAAWTDLKDKEAIPVHEEQKDLRICQSSSYFGEISLGSIKQDMKPDVNIYVRVLVLSEKGKDIAKRVQK